MYYIFTSVAFHFVTFLPSFFSVLYFIFFPFFFPFLFFFFINSQRDDAGNTSPCLKLPRASYQAVLVGQYALLSPLGLGIPALEGIQDSIILTITHPAYFTGYGIVV